MTEAALRDPVLATRPMSPATWFLRTMILEADRRRSWLKMRDRIDALEACTSHFAPSNEGEKSVAESPNQQKTLGINSERIGQASRSLTPAERTELSNLRRRMSEEATVPWKVADPREIEDWQREMAGRRTALRGRAA